MSERSTGFAVPVLTAFILRRLRQAAAACCLRLRRLLQRLRQRRYLIEMDARMLRDIGADRGEVWREARKWWWQA
jgi:uncharacterized protein YjiS (DUF1127 family)